MSAGEWGECRISSKNEIAPSTALSLHASTCVARRVDTKVPPTTYACVLRYLPTTQCHFVNRTLASPSFPRQHLRRPGVALRVTRTVRLFKLRKPHPRISKRTQDKLYVILFVCLLVSHVLHRHFHLLHTLQTKCHIGTPSPYFGAWLWVSIARWALHFLSPTTLAQQ